MNTTRNTLLWVATAASVIGISAGVRANTYTWNGGTSADWNTAANWTPTGGPPTSTDTAVFSGASSNTSVTLSSAGNALGVNFGGSTGYTVGTTSGSAIDLASGGYVDVQSGDTAAQIINAPLVLGGNETFTNDASGSANTLTVGGGITGTAGSSATDTLTLTGTNTGANAVNGVIGDGSGGGNVAVATTGGSWILGGANTYSGGTTVDNGASLEYTNTAAFGSGAITIGTSGTSPAQNGTLVAGVGGTLANNINSTLVPNSFNTNGFTTTLTGTITSKGWTITGGGTLIFDTMHNSGQNYGETVDAGTTLEVASGGYFGNGNLQLNAGTFVATATVATTVLGSAGSTVSIASANSGILNWDQSKTYSGAIIGAGSFTANGQWFWTSGAETLNGANGLANFTGTLGVQYDGILNVSLASGLSGNAVAFTGGAYNQAASATTETLNFTGTGSVTVGAVNMSLGNPWGSVSTASSAVNVIDAGAAGNTVTITGPISSVDNTASTLVVQDGKFVLSGGIASGSVQVAGTGSLSNINFSIGSGGSLAGSGTLTWNLNGNSGDLLTDNGTLNITGLNLVLNVTGAQTLDQYVLVDYAGGTLTGAAFASVTGLAAGWTIDYSGTSLHPSSIVLSRVPEPASLGLLGVGGLGLLLVKRRKMAV